MPIQNFELEIKHKDLKNNVTWDVSIFNKHFKELDREAALNLFDKEYKRSTVSQYRLVDRKHGIVIGEALR